MSADFPICINSDIISYNNATEGVYVSWWKFIVVVRLIRNTAPWYTVRISSTIYNIAICTVQLALVNHHIHCRSRIDNFNSVTLLHIVSSQSETCSIIFYNNASFHGSNRNVFQVDNTCNLVCCKLTISSKRSYQVTTDIDSAIINSNINQAKFLQRIRKICFVDDAFQLCSA